MFKVVVLVVVVSTVPPTTRLHTPPLSWLGLGPPGELTKALDEVRNDVLTVFMVAISDDTAVPPLAAEKPLLVLATKLKLLEHCACASVHASIPASAAAPPSSALLRASNRPSVEACELRLAKLTRAVCWFPQPDARSPTRTPTITTPNSSPLFTHLLLFVRIT